LELCSPTERYRGRGPKNGTFRFRRLRDLIARSELQRIQLVALPGDPVGDNLGIFMKLIYVYILSILSIQPKNAHYI
jgi:hypothetical protein